MFFVFWVFLTVMLNWLRLFIPLYFLHAHMKTVHVILHSWDHRVALKQNECHLLGRKPYFQSLEQPLPFHLDRLKLDGFKKNFFFLLFQGQGNTLMAEK